MSPDEAQQRLLMFNYFRQPHLPQTHIAAIVLEYESPFMRTARPKKSCKYLEVSKCKVYLT